MTELTAPAQQLDFGIWSVVLPEGWQFVPNAGLHTEPSGEGRLSMVFGEEALSENQSLATYVANEQALLRSLVGTLDMEVTPITIETASDKNGACAFPDEVMQAVIGGIAQDGYRLAAIQLYCRIGRLVAVVSCVSADAEFAAVLPRIGAALKFATIRSGTESGHAVSLPSLPSTGFES